MRCVLARRIASTTFDAGILIDLGLGNIVKVQILPVGDIWRRAPDQIIQRHLFFIEILREPRNHFLNDLEPVGHRGCTHLHVSSPQGQKLCCITPCRNPANPTDWEVRSFCIARDISDHIQGNRFDGRPTITAVRPLPVNRRLGRKTVQID